jgi:23S rRNA (uracil1939-C5)-methyltransferase
MDSVVIKQPDKTTKTLEVEIERLLPGGVGLAHAEGLTLFMSLAAPGDVLRVRIDRIKGKVGFASIVEIIKPSPVRIEPPCPYFGRCGGCDFQQLNYEAQLDAKVEIIRDCLRRIAQIESPAHIEIEASPLQWHYRARANWQLDPATKRFGYFEQGSRRVCDVEYCAVLAPELQETLEHLRKELDEEKFAVSYKDIDAVTGDDGISLAPSLAGFQIRDVQRVIGNETYFFNAEAFFQINHALLESLLARAIGEVSGKTAIDLYCGVGLFTVPLARRFETVVGVESNRVAAEFARRNLEHAQLQNGEIVTDSVGEWLNENATAFDPPDFLLLDPPRAGAENKVIAGILSLRPRQISYVSCDPATLARDLKKLVAGGYSLDSLKAFDMFPQTHHVETVAHLSLK